MLAKCQTFFVPPSFSVRLSSLKSSILDLAASSSSRVSALPLSQRESNYQKLEQILGDEIVVVAITKAPNVLAYDPSSVSVTFSIYSETYGRTKALGIIQRNPLLLGLSENAARKAGDDAWALSYVIDFTRGSGNILLAILGSLLLIKPFIALTTLITEKMVNAI